MIIFKQQRKKLDSGVKIKLSRKNLYPSQSDRDSKIVKNRNRKHANNIGVKLNIANALLFKIRNFANINTLKIIYSPVFAPHTDYANLVWVQHLNSLHIEYLLCKKKPRKLSIFNHALAIQFLYF